MSAPTDPRDVAASEIAPQLDELHAQLIATKLDAAHLVQVHEFLDIDPDIANRDYLPMRGRKAIPGLYPNTSSAADYAASQAAGYVTPVVWDDCEPTFAPQPVADVPVIGGGL